MRVVPALVTVVLPGFGQAAAGRTVRGVVWAGASVVVLATALWMPWMGLVALALHVASAIDAYVCLRRAEQPDWMTNAAFAVGGIGLVPAAIGVLFLHAYKMPSSSMYPTLEIGDHVFSESLTSHLRPLERGDVIVFHYPCDRARDYVKRVIALAGDAVEVRCNVVYVNGKAIEASLVAADTTYDDYDERSDHWFPRQTSRYHEQLDDHAYDIYDDPDRPQREAGKQRVEAGMRDFPVAGRPPSCANADDQDHSLPDRGKLVTTAPDDPDKPCAPHVHYVVPEHAVFTLGDNRNNSNDSRIWGALDTALVTGRVRWIWWARHLSRVGRVE